MRSRWEGGHQNNNKARLKRPHKEGNSKDRAYMSCTRAYVYIFLITLGFLYIWHF